MRKPRLARESDKGATCRLCSKKVRVGEAIVAIRVSLSPLTEADVHMHTACMHAVADRAPESKVFPRASAAQYAKFKRELVASVAPT